MPKPTEKQREALGFARNSIESRSLRDPALRKKLKKARAQASGDAHSMERWAKSDCTSDGAYVMSGSGD